VLIAVTLFFHVPVWALNPALEISQYAHTSWLLREGAFRGIPRVFAQTRDGYMWIGTDLGLLVFDGIRLSAWRPPSGELPSSSVVSLLATRDGSLWIGTSGGLARFDGNTLIPYRELAGEYIVTLLETRDGTVWFGTSAGFNSTAKLCSIKVEQIQCQQNERALGRFVLKLFQDHEGAIWVGSATGLWKWTTGGMAPYVLPQSFPPEIHDIIEDRDKSIVLALNRDIARVNDNQVTLDRRFAVLATLKPTAAMGDRDGALWIGTQDRGVLHLGNGPLDSYASVDNLSGNFVTDIFEDREGNVWVATLNGFDRFREFTASTLSVRQGLSSNNVTTVLSTRDGALWIGTTNGLNRLVEGKVERARVSLPDPVVTSLFEDRLGQVWVASQRGVVVLHQERIVRTIDTQGHVHIITEDSGGDIWISDQDRGLLRFRGDESPRTVPWSTFGGKRVRSMLPDRTRGGLWLGFYGGGVVHFADGNILKSYSTQDGLGDGDVTALQFDPDGVLWAATSRGLSRLGNRSVATLGKKNGLACESIHWFLQDSADSFWVRTACGLLRLNRSELAAWAADPTRTLQLTTYEDFDGVVSHTETGSYGPKAAMSADGRIWFVSFDGVGVLDPKNLAFNPVPPPVRVEQVMVDRIAYAPTPSPHLPPRVRDLRIDYTALSFVSGQRVQFRYLLEGRDRDWIDAGNRRQAFYTDLRPGRYRFRVIAANNSGVWNNKGATLDFQIASAFHQTRMFQLAVLGLLAATLAAIYRLRLRQVSTQLNVRFEERLAERTRIAQDLHDTLLQGFISASMQLHVVADELADHGVRPKLDNILRRITLVLQQGRQTLHTLRMRSDEIVDLETVLARDVEDFRGQEDVDVRIVVDGQREPLRPSVRDEVYNIIREALANAFRHARARRIEVEIAYGMDCLDVYVRDNGRGLDDFSAAQMPGHWGICGMQERARKIGATLRIWSRANAGTEIALTVPAHIVFKRATRSRMPWTFPFLRWGRLRILHDTKPARPAETDGPHPERKTD